MTSVDDPMTSVDDPMFETGLTGEAILFRTGVEGVYGRSETFQVVVDAVGRLVNTWGLELHATTVRFPPVVARTTFDATNYLRSFPDLVGSVQSFRGSDREHAELVRRLEGHEEWSDLAGPADVVLCPSACHPVYPLCTGSLPDGGRYFNIRGYCFRNEPSLDPSRMRTFEMQELVYVGEEANAVEHRDRGVKCGLAMLGDLGLEVDAAIANDPFFGRIGRFLGAQQVDAELKVEVVTPVSTDGGPTALMSANYHRDHFAVPFGIATADGTVAHSACVGFGLDRVAIALFRCHGVAPKGWPNSVTDRLWPS